MLYFSFTPGLRGLGPSTLLPRAPSPASQVTWLSGSTTPAAATTAAPKCASPGPILASPRASSVTTIQQYTQGRPTSMTGVDVALLIILCFRTLLSV